MYQDKLESKRIITRKLTLDDITVWFEFLNDKQSTEFLPAFGITDNKERAEIWIEKQIGRYNDNRYGLQALLDKQTGEFLGQCGLLTQEVDGITETEVGYHIFRKHWGKGYAPEAAKLFIDYAFDNNLTDSVISIIDVNNLKSQKVAGKNGLIREKQTKWNELDVFIYRIKNNSK